MEERRFEEKKNKRGLSFWFTIIFLFFAAIVIVLTGFGTYYTQFRSYETRCEENIKNVGEYLSLMMQDEGANMERYQEYYLDHYRDMKIPYDFDDYATAKKKFESMLAEEAPGKTLGVDIELDDLSDEVQEAYFIYTHEYWLKTFEEAREAFDLPYTYYLVLGDERGRLEDVKEKDDLEHTVIYMIDGERTKDDRVGPNGEEYLFLGDTYYNSRDTHEILWITWETGKSQRGFMEWDNSWGHTYGYYVPLIVDGKKLGIIATEINVENVSHAAMISVLNQVIIITVVFIAGLILTLIVIRLRFINRLKKLENAMNEYSRTRDAAIASDIAADFNTPDEIGSLGRGFSAMISELSEYMTDLLRTSSMLRKSKRHESELSEQVVMDSLSGVRSNNEYDREVFGIARDLSAGRVDFGILLVNVINTKMMVETYGILKCDIARRKILHRINDIFKTSSIYRIETDLFAVILKGEDLKNAEGLVDRFEFEVKSENDKEGFEYWEAPLAAVGFAVYDERRDGSSFKSVYERAQTILSDRKKKLS